MKILVTTGCSYTHYRYYTWADYLSKGYDKFFNLGMAGSSIKFSYIKVLDYIRANKDTLNNTDIFIQWTSLKRHYLINEDPPKGQIDNNADFNEEFIKNYFDIEDKAIELYNYIEHLILLSEKYKFRIKMFYMFEPWIGDYAGEPTNTSIILHETTKKYLESSICTTLKNLYSKEYWITPSLESFSLKNEKRGPEHRYPPEHGGGIDEHPTTEQHRMFSEHINKGRNFPKKDIL